MPILRWLRSAAALYTIPLIAFYEYIVLSGEFEFLSDNFLAATVLATSGTVVAATPVCAAAGAWEGYRLRRGGVREVPSARSTPTVILWSLFPVLIAAAVSMAFSFALVLPRATGSPGPLDAAIVVLALLVICAWTVTGLAAGRFLHPALGVPILLVGLWFWMAYPDALEPFWLRHMTGSNLGHCCETHSTFDRRALYSQALVALGVLAAGYLIWSFRGRTRWALTSGALTVVAVITGAATLIQGMGPEAERPRTSGLVCKTQENISICLWREREKRIDDVAPPILSAAHGISAATGRPLPATVTEGPADGNRSWRFRAAPGSTESQLRFALAGLMPSSPPKGCEDGEGQLAYEPLGGWLGVKAGVDKDEIAQRIGQDNVAIVKEVLRRSASYQRTWFERNERALTQCGVKPFDLRSRSGKGGSP
ncbi:DUF7224 domain-containing protein [Actinomadura terrae]|uniref:DUF7224 domain-containing protein n=1 Tax=Actinomadura terrae TaxID=604353 RepID=UPI001FA76C14|nr:hypothetical protein [Actinomadura terrae]